jgi:endonuclease-3
MPGEKARSGRSRARKALPAIRVTRELRARASAVLDGLDALYPDAGTELDHEDPYQLLVAVILSAQCTDKRVNLVTPRLFAAFPDAAALARAEPEDLHPYVNSCGLYRNKAKNLVICARDLLARHGGAVPGTREDLEALAGVGRKTANVVLANAFGVDAIAVDTHVHRLSQRLGFSRARDPEGVERDLMAVFPQERWRRAHHTLIWHGRRCCHARKPDCPSCPVRRLCPSALPE